MKKIQIIINILIVVVLMSIAAYLQGYTLPNIKIPIPIAMSVCIVAILYKAIPEVMRTLKEKKYIRMIILIILNLLLLTYFIYYPIYLGYRF